MRNVCVLSTDKEVSFLTETNVKLLYCMSKTFFWEGKKLYHTKYETFKVQNNNHKISLN